MMFFYPVGVEGQRQRGFPFMTLALSALLLLVHLRVESVAEHIQEVHEVYTRTHGNDFGDAEEQARKSVKLEALQRKDLRERWAFSPRAFSAHEPSKWPAIALYAVVHGSWAHLLGNLLMLFLVGIPIERRYGSGRLLALLIAGSVTGALAFAIVARQADQERSMIGASGAIAGLMGAFTIWFWNARIRLWWGALLLVYPVWGVLRIPARVLLPIWFVVEALSAWLEHSGITDGVAHSAHVGGFIAGVVVALGTQLWSNEEGVGAEDETEGVKLVRSASAYDELRSHLLLQPEDVSARMRALFSAIHHGDHGAAASDFEVLCRLFASEPQRTLALYRRVREQYADLRFSEPALLRVIRVAESIGDSRVVVEAARALALGYPFSNVLPQVLRKAAAAQRRLRVPHAWVAETEAAITAIEAAPSTTTVEARLSSEAIEQVQARRAVGAPSPAILSAHIMPTTSSSTQPEGNASRYHCKNHPTQRSIGQCAECSTPVCAQCSTRIESSRICRECRTRMLQARELYARPEAWLHALGSAFRVVGLSTLVGVPVLYATARDYRVTLTLLALLAGMSAVWVGRALLSREGDAATAALLGAPLLFFFPLGTALSALLLFILYGKKGEFVFGSSFAKVRAATPERDPKLHSLTSLALMLFLGLSVVGSLVLSIRALKQGDFSDRYAIQPEPSWRQGDTFQVLSDMTRTGRKAGVVVQASTASARALGETTYMQDGLPLRFEYAVRQFSLDRIPSRPWTTPTGSVEISHFGKRIAWDNQLRHERSDVNTVLDTPLLARLFPSPLPLWRATNGVQWARLGQSWDQPFGLESVTELYRPPGASGSVKLSFVKQETCGNQRCNVFENVVTASAPKASWADNVPPYSLPPHMASGTWQGGGTDLSTVTLTNRQTWRILVDRKLRSRVYETQFELHGKLARSSEDVDVRVESRTEFVFPNEDVVFVNTMK
jgi:membrane associated rhomboid family serine protease